jgi:hypothetical protein
VSATRAIARASAFGGQVELRFPFSQRLVKRLKRDIPSQHRSWDREAKVWRVTEPYTNVAIDLLVARFPTAETPDTRVRHQLAAAIIGRSIVPEILPPPQPALDSAPTALAPIQVNIPCPCCHVAHERTIQVVAETSAKATKHAITPELVSVCPHCSCLAVVAFFPAIADGLAPS